MRRRRGFGGVVALFKHDGVEFQGLAELNLVVRGAVQLGLVGGALIGDEGLQGLFGDGAVAGRSVVLLGEGAGFAAGDVGGGGGGGVGMVGCGDEGDGFVCG